MTAVLHYSMAGLPSVFVAPGLDLRLEDVVVVPHPDLADVVLAGPSGWPGERPVVSLGGGDRFAGHLAADASPEQIAAAVRAVAAGLIVRMPRTDDGFAPLEEPVSGDLLTPRELDVLRAMGEGGSNKVIARQLGISLHTVKFHVEALFRKLDAHSRAEAVVKGLRFKQL
ncbi:response regulator transcription factor [Asticcacaulis solisilvae]|uniref:response regulator transcription factor n=1 Tax=Asticcacaulis solisilvae TaxID=1217274 RepID=UPI003FD6D8EA